MPSATPKTVPSQTSTTTASSSFSTLGSPPTTLSSYNNTMLSYTRAQFQQFRDTASTTAAPELGQTRDSSSTAGTTSSSGSLSRTGKEGSGPPVSAHDFASGRKA
ncbi:hypothetical protein V493_07154 [Pseudogymnoascus sp. VKM F-4281 (FW-2241)]|nr:hypothetical protein V493_07154 [Pseudogymnoascus sp. VKM F-4281 (FW-2241)]